jgi:adenine deaminase
MQAEYVISNGKIVARDGHLKKAPRIHRFATENLKSVHLAKKIKPEEFRIRTPEGSRKTRLRVIDMVTDLVTQERVQEFSVNDGEIRIDTDKDFLKVAVVDRTLSPGKIYTGMIHGFGMTSGALACSAAWDTTNIVVVGADEADMALAVNRVGELQGGTVLCCNEEILQELPLPILGIMGDLPLEEIDKRIKALTAEAAKLGVLFRNPVLTLITLTGAAIPFLRICEEGLVNLKNGETVELFAAT